MICFYLYMNYKMVINLLIIGCKINTAKLFTKYLYYGFYYIFFGK